MGVKKSFSAIIATLLVAALPLTASAQFSVGVGFTVGTPPPPMPYYTQPAAPYPNWQWQPGYWAWGSAGYYWVPGTWVAPPAVGTYWTPGYWGYNNGYYGWNAGYWGASVGFYGGINYGFGYPGTGFYGGTWGAGGFAYNTAVANVNRTVIHNTYNKTVINKNVCNNCKNVSYNGGHGGVQARPTQAQIDARRDGRAPTTAQVNQAKAASQDRNLAYNVNHGKPGVTAVQKPVSDPKQLRGYAPVTDKDKQVAQRQARPNAQSATMQSNNAAHKPASTTQNNASAHRYNQHPSGSMESQSAMRAHSNRPQSSANGQAQMHSQSRPSSERPYGQHPQGQRPPSGGQRPPGGGNPNRPPSGSDKDKPPRG